MAQLYSSAWFDERVLPSYLSVFSSIILIGQIVKQLRPLMHLRAHLSQYETLQDSNSHLLGINKDGSNQYASSQNTLFHALRLLATGVLCVLTLSMAGGVYGIYIALSSTSVYVAVLAFIIVVRPTTRVYDLSAHVTIIVFSTFVVYAYRDLWPLCTFTLSPQDKEEGWSLWARIGLTAFVGFALPLFEPSLVAVTKNGKPAKEYGPSLISFMTFSFLDPLIHAASRASHLGFDKLPALRTEDRTDALVKQFLPYLDPFPGAATGAGLFWKFCVLFRRPLLAQVVLLSANALAGFASPIGINRLLAYLENKDDDVIVRPFVWIAWLALGPIAVTVTNQLYFYFATQPLVKVEAIITSLVFDHALRMRVGAQASNIKTSASSASETSTTDSNLEESSDANAVQTQANNAGGSSPEISGKEIGKVTGQVNSLVTVDIQTITSAHTFLFTLINVPINLILGLIFLWIILGWSAIVGMITMFALFPIPMWVSSRFQGTQEHKMAATDARVKQMTESISMLRMIKLFAYEALVLHELATKRDEELKWIWRNKVYELGNNIINHIIPLFHLVVTYFCYTLIQKESLTASIVYSSLTLFELLRNQIFQLFSDIPGLIQARVSLNRIQDFLIQTELVDQFSSEYASIRPANSDVDLIGLCDAEFVWSSHSTDKNAPQQQQRAFHLKVDGRVLFTRCAINIIVGPTGSGKTSLLMALLGEMHYVSSSPEAWVNLSRKDGFAYAAQESWVLNETIKDNIVFGAYFDKERYKKVLFQCALERDLELFAAGDATEVGEGGLTLSGGQKARITLARAVYSQAAVLLLDDILAALDVSTARWIVEKCLSGDLLEGRTVILVTHHVAMLSPIAKTVTTVVNGRVTSKGSVTEALAEDKNLAEGAIHEKIALEFDKVEDKVVPADDNADKMGQLIAAEEIIEGRLNWNAIMLFVGSMATQRPWLFWITYVLGCWGSEIFLGFESWWLGWWAQRYLHHTASEVSVFFFLGIFGLVVLGSIVTHSLGVAMSTWGSIRASRSIHQRLTMSVFGSTFRWLDITPVSRIITRCTQDIAAIDGQFARNFDWLVNIILSMITHQSAIVFFSPIFIIPSLFIATVGWLCGRLFMRAQMSVKREMSNAKAPVLSVVGSVISAGLVSIRAYDAQSRVRKDLYLRLDKLMTSSASYWLLNRWIAIRIDVLSAMFTASLATYLVYGPIFVSPSNIGFSLSRAVLFSRCILHLVHMVNTLEVEGNNLERILSYLKIDQEPKPTQEGVPPAYWPSSGELRVEKLSAKYTLDGPPVLHDLTFHIKSGERVGIVGRTGSGKSSLALSLLRCIYTKGEVYYDDIPTSSLNLDALRSNITIIPQIPELLSGTVRHNLDLLGEHDDTALNDALRAAGLDNIQRNADHPAITLDSSILDGGANISVGQRQIIALARAMIRQSKLLILDEATSAIDHDTDAAIQDSLRHELKKDVTVLCVAHRLQTIMDSNKIMVLDAGCLVEFASPRELLGNEKSFFRKLVDQSSDKASLYALAGMESPQ